MKIGYVVAASTPFEFLATLDPQATVGLYEYVEVAHVDFPEVGQPPTDVRLLGQIVKLYRDPYSAKRDIPLYEVMKDVADQVLEVQLAKVKVLGYPWEGALRLPKTPPRIGAEVFQARDEDVQELLRVDVGLCVGRLASRDVEVCLDLNGIRRHVAVIAATGSGKTWFSVVLLEELLKRGGKVVVIDPHGEYVPVRDSIGRLGPYTAKVVKVSRRHLGDVMYRLGVIDSDPEALATAAGVPPKASKIRYAIYLAWAVARRVGKATGRRPGLKFLISLLSAVLAGQPSAKSLAKKAGLDPNDEKLAELLDWGPKNKDALFNALRYLRRLRRLGIFAPASTPLSQMLADVTVVNLAGVGEEVQDYVVAHLVERIFKARVRAVRGLEGPRLEKPVVIFVEEAHRFAPPKARRRTRSYEALARVASEGRKFGAYLVVITQRPSRVDPDILSQCQSQVVMRVVNPRDQIAIEESSELMAVDFLENLPGLDVGEAIVLGPLVKMPVAIRLRDRVLDYGGGDIDLASEWSPRELDIGQLWRRLFNSPPALSVQMAAEALRPVARQRVDGGWRVTLEEAGRPVTVEYADGRVHCSACGPMKPCRHAYRALQEVAQA